MNISVVIPVHNEEQALPALIMGLRQHVPDAEIIVVDDGSTDTSAATARRLGARVINHPYKIGNGAAVKTGMRHASGDTIVLMDGDGQHDPADIPRMLTLAGDYDMVVGARSRGSHANLFRLFANSIYNFLASYVTKFAIRDLTSGFRVLRKETALRYLCLLPNTFSYPTTITLAFLRSGRSIFYVPITAHPRIGTSKIRILHDGFVFLLIIIKITTLYSPLHIFLPVSALLFIMGLVNYIYWFITETRFTNMSAMCILSSLMIFMMGLISEQITQMRYDRIENGG
ncbi:MAG: glycosyltransferase family 2 protein [Deltaproteobacteria bacterium]|nr:glycosyltransferase family 2 protein [Deltaproteobacteria bacterium]